MSNYKEFQGKSLDEAIKAACDHFDLKRDKLEVEIVSGGSTGIFGLVGAKKATVKARPRNATAFMQEKPEPEKKPAQPQDKGEQNKREQALTKHTKAQTPAKREEAKVPAKQKNEIKQDQEARSERKPRAKKEPQQPSERKPREQRKPRDEQPSNNRQPQISPFSEINKDDLEQTVREVTVTLIEQLVMAPKLEVKVGKDRVNVHIDEPEHSGLIIGREGQTLSSLQYLVNRIVSRRMETSVRVQIDTGDYRERQDDKLRQTADHLAKKAITSGRTQSTKPMSSYHRRIVHLTLQDDERVFTRSKGDGPLKRVLIVPKKNRSNGRERENNDKGNTNKIVNKINMSKGSTNKGSVNKINANSNDESSNDVNGNR